MMKRIVILSIAVCLPAVAAAQDSDKYQCTFGDLQRRVEVAHEPGVEVPCSVQYFKDTEMPGEQQVLWSADRDSAYCKDKAAELVTKLEGWGWDCGQGNDAADEPDVAETEELLGDPDVGVDEDQ